MTIKNDTLAKRVFYYRKKVNKWTQPELADLAGLCVDTIVHMETERGAQFKINLLSVAKVAAAFRIPLTTLLFDLEPEGGLYDGSVDRR